MKIEEFLLESWFRKHGFTTPIVICSSGVEEFTLGEIRQLLGIEQGELDNIVFSDSQSMGSFALRKSIAQRWGNGIAEEIIVTHGSSEAIFLIMNTLLEKGDEIIVLAPYYQALYSIPKAIGCRVKTWALQYNQQFVPDLDKLNMLVGPNTRMVVVNFPNNPTGASISEVQLRSLIKIVSKVGAYLVWDAAFAELTYDCPPLSNPCLQYERAISLGTLSKAYGLPGLRVGWCCATQDILARCMQLRDYVTLSLSPLTEFIARCAIEKASILLDNRLQQARTNLRILNDWIDSQSDIVGCVPPKGGVSVFLRLLHVSDVDVFCNRLATEYGVFVLPGTCFSYPGYVRLGFGGNTEQLRKGLSCISNLLTNGASL